jgi:hypothetical protein
LFSGSTVSTGPFIEATTYLYIYGRPKLYGDKLPVIGKINLNNKMPDIRGDTAHG